MSSLTLYDEDRFNRDLGVLFSGGLASGIVAAMLVAIAGGHQHELMALSFGGLIGIAASFTKGEGETPILRVILALLGGVLLAGAFPTALVAAVVGGSALGLALSVEGDMTERIASMSVFAIALGSAFFTSSVLFEDGFLQSANVPMIREFLTGGIWGTFMAAGAGIKQIRWDHDERLAELQEAISEVGASERGYLRSARELYGPIREEVEKADDQDLQRQAETITAETLMALQRLTRRSTELREAMSSNPGRNIGRRLERLEGQLDVTDDPTVRQELNAARRELEKEREARNRLEVAITRLEVRQQRCVTALERLHMSLVETGNVESGDIRLENSLDELEDLTDEIQWRNLSLDDICDPISDEIESEAAALSDEEFVFDSDSEVDDLDGETDDRDVADVELEVDAKRS